MSYLVFAHLKSNLKCMYAIACKTIIFFKWLRVQIHLGSLYTDIVVIVLMILLPSIDQMSAQSLLITDSELPAVKVYQQNRGWGHRKFFLPLHEHRNKSVI